MILSNRCCRRISRVFFSLFFAWVVFACNAAAQTPPVQAELPPDLQAYRAAMRIADSQKRIEALEQLMIDFPQSRYTSAVPNLILDLLIKGGAAQKQKIVAQANKIVDKNPDYARSAACHTVATKFAEIEFLLEEAETFAAKAVSSFKESDYIKSQREIYLSRNQQPPLDEMLSRRFLATKANYLATLGQLYLKRGKDAEAEKAFKDAQKANPSLISALVGLAALTAKAGNSAKALEMLTEVALSGRMTPAARTLLEELYSKTHPGSPAGLDAMLDEKYLKLSPNPLHPKPYKAKSSRTDRVVLAEVFTGAGCPPCVAADLAFDAVLERYERKDVAVLMYHVHIPRPDPMTNTAAQTRASLYSVSGVPHYAIDGQAEGGGGSRDATEKIYERINPNIEKGLETASRAELKLDATIAGDVVKVKTVVSRIESQSQSLKLHIALVETKLRYSGENGVRFHPMVVRSLAGPNASGFRVAAGQPTTVEYSFNLKQISDDLKAQLEAYEQRNTDYKFAEKKHAIDAGNLAVVAFVQDEASLKILQASYIALKPAASVSSVQK